MSESVSSRAVLSLVFGILAFNGCPCIGGVLAIALGSGEKSGVARAGVVLGWIHLALVALMLVAFVVFGLFAGIAKGFH